MTSHPHYEILPSITYDSSNGSLIQHHSTLTKEQFKKLRSIVKNKSRNQSQLLTRVDTLYWQNTCSKVEEVGIYTNDLTTEEIEIILKE